MSTYRPLPLPALTGLRFLLAAGVVAFHASLIDPGLVRYTSPFAQGVTAFFVLSGFILVHVYGSCIGGAPGWRRAFYAARIARVWPLHALLLLVYLPLAPVTGAPASLAGAWLANLTLLHAWLPFPVFHLWNSPTWTLSCEAAMYALFPLLAGLVWRRSPSARAALGWAALALALLTLAELAVGLARSIAPASWHFPLGWSPLVALWQFTLGVAVGVAYQRGLRLPRRLARAAPPLVLAAALAAGALDLGAAWWLPVAATPLAALLILALADTRGWLAHPWLLALGEASYALYLLHDPPLLWLQAHGVGLGWHAAWLLALIPLSLAAHARIERPARAALRRLSERAPVHRTASHGRAVTGAAARSAAPRPSGPDALAPAPASGSGSYRPVAPDRPQ